MLRANGKEPPWAHGARPEVPGWVGASSRPSQAPWGAAPAGTRRGAEARGSRSTRARVPLSCPCLYRAHIPAQGQGAGQDARGVMDKGRLFLRPPAAPHSTAPPPNASGSPAAPSPASTDPNLAASLQGLPVLSPSTTKELGAPRAAPGAVNPTNGPGWRQSPAPGMQRGRGAEGKAGARLPRACPGTASPFSHESSRKHK